MRLSGSAFSKALEVVGDHVEVDHEARGCRAAGGEEIVDACGRHVSSHSSVRCSEAAQTFPDP
jgi:hypothetical protein